MAVSDRIQELIERFKFNEASYRSGSYNETQLRREFLDPFFEELGWDINNIQGYAEAYKDVIHEDAIKVGGATKAPDYCFRIGGARKFFLEAKKPSVNIKEDISPAFQLRRYAWSAKLPLSVLSDFEEFAVYDCRTEPVKTDKASTARILYCRFTDYPDKWDEIAGIFSKEAILKGSFDKYASGKNRKGTLEVDAAFLKDIEEWRDALAKNLALRNPNLTTRQLNFAVQRTIDRLIFLRICEDRGIENYGRLQNLLKSDNIYPELGKLFQHADDRYNSGLFHFRKEKDRLEPPDDLTLKLSLDDKPLKEILRKLYYPDSPYEFSVLPADILGQVYEQFLGKVIRLTAGHQAKVEEKPEVRKAGGVYYTPTYIVDYIVKQTVGKLCEGKTPKEVAKLRILDPACGSGSFLLGAYQFLLDWHRDWYTQHEPEKLARGKNSAIFQGSNGEWRLSTGERKRILLNNIYGVDIDAQAVETTKLSLLLKVLEGETAETVGQSQRLFQERALPDLGDNIKCGNSLIGPDFYEQAQLAFFDEEERYRINDFNWATEFAPIMNGGGFDTVIGNPPYGALFSSMETQYLLSHYPRSQKFADSYCLFIEKAIGLVKEDGLASFIVPNTFCDLENCQHFRSWILKDFQLQQIWQSGWAFKSAIVDTLVFLIKKQPSPMLFSVEIQVDGRKYNRLLNTFLQNQLHKIDYRNSDEDRVIFNKVLATNVPLGEMATVKAGVKMYEKGKGTPSQTEEVINRRPYSVKNASPVGWKLLYRGEHIARYKLIFPNEYVSYGQWLAAPRTPQLFESPKILMRRTDDRLLSCLEPDSSICVNSCHVIKLKQPDSDNISYHYLLGVLNSRLLQRIFELQNPQMIGKVFAEIKVIYVERLPIRTINFNDSADRARHDRMVTLVEQMLDLHRQLAAAKTAHEQTSAQRQIETTDRQIDRLVYELYELTEDEIRIVESEAA